MHEWPLCGSFNAASARRAKVRFGPGAAAAAACQAHDPLRRRMTASSPHRECQFLAARALRGTAAAMLRKVFQRRSESYR